MKLTNSQKKAVEKLYNAYLKRSEEKMSYFKAPTGSGKTFMASELISRIFSSNSLNGVKTIIIVATISNAELPRQFSKKLNSYKGFHDFNSYTVEHITSPSTSKTTRVEDIKEFDVEPNKVYVFGKASFGRNTLFYQNGTLESLFQRAKITGTEIIYIRDEAHIGGEKGQRLSSKDEKSFDEKMISNSSFTLQMTATPDDNINLVEMTREDMERDGQYLLKTNDLGPELVGEVSNGELIDDAIQTLISSKKEYAKLENLSKRINPAMLIQVSSDSNTDSDKKKKFDESMEELEKKLFDKGLAYLIYFENRKEVHNTKAPATLEYASEIDSIIDVIIFKVGPATGWDIPRANILLQLRNVSSEKLNMQTLGRIMRNPLDDLSKNEITDKYYLYSNFQKPTRDYATYKLKNKFIDKKLSFGYVDEKSKAFKHNVIDFKNDVKEFVLDESFLRQIKDLQPSDIVYDSLEYNSLVIPNPIENIFKLKAFNLKKEEEYKKLISISDYENEFEILAKKTGKNIDMIKYQLWKNISNIKEIKNRNTNWIHEDEPYKIEKSGLLMNKYNIWVGNNKNLKVDTEGDFGDKYGYRLISNEDDVQWLDSRPEMAFYEKINKVLTSEQRENISFFAKMPTLGSKIYFEYYSKTEGKIQKSFMDFAIEYNGKVIMVEVKSKENDYDANKTDDLKSAYKMYMEKNDGIKLSLVVYQHDEVDSVLSAYVDGEWTEELGFKEVFNSLLN